MASAAERWSDEIKIHHGDRFAAPMAFVPFVAAQKIEVSFARFDGMTNGGRNTEPAWPGMFAVDLDAGTVMQQRVLLLEIHFNGDRASFELDPLQTQLIRLLKLLSRLPQEVVKLLRREAAWLTHLVASLLMQFYQNGKGLFQVRFVRHMHGRQIRIELFPP